MLVSAGKAVQRAQSIELSLISDEFRERLNGSQCVILNVLDLFQLVLGPFLCLGYCDWVGLLRNAPTFGNTGRTVLSPGRSV